MTESKSKFWIDIAVGEIIKAFPEGEIVLSSGISPSASYHIGHFREIMTADALTWGLRRAGRKVRHIHVVDNFDPLRKRYSFLPERFEEFVGQPICLIPDPIGDCHETYAEHFYKEFEHHTAQMSIHPDEVVRSYEQLYKPGKMATQIEQVLENNAKIVKIFEETSNRKLEADWTPVQVLTNEGFVNAKPSDWDKDAQTVAGKDYAKGEVKLNWRLDWPARWAVLGVMVEPFSLQEHGAAGGSYETGAKFAKEVFGITPPIPGVQYANIHLVGETTKMSSSKGNLVTPKDALEVMPPEILRYFVVRSRPERTLVFDPGIGLFNLIDEFSAVQDAVHNNQPTEFAEAYQFATDGITDRVISSIRFNHLVTLYQAAQRDTDKTIAKLKEQTEYKDLDWSKEAPIVEKQLEFVANWLDKYAPDELKFSVQEELPKLDISDTQKQFLFELAGKVENMKQPEAQTMHDAIYAAKGDMNPAEAFQTLYQVILGQDKGPRAGWFLASLDQEWLTKRLRLES